MALYFEAPDDKKTMIENLGRADGVTSVQTFHGGSFLVFLECRNEAPLDGQLALIEALCGIQASMSWTRNFPSFDLAMSPTDWLILRALRRDPMRSLNEIAQEVGISQRTLNRRMERLVEGDAFYIETIVNFQKIGRLSFTLLVYCSDGGKKRSLDDLIWRKLSSLCEGRDTISSSSHSVFSIFADNLTEAKETYEWVRNLEGVLDARMGIHEGRSLINSWINDEIETRSPVFGPNIPEPRVRTNRPARPYVIPKRSQKGTKGGDSWWSGSFLEGRRIKVTLDSAICMGSGSCVEVAPKVFQLDLERKKSVFDPAPLRLLKDRTANLEDVFLAAQSCPYRVIKLEDVDTGEQLFP